MRTSILTLTAAALLAFGHVLAPSPSTAQDAESPGVVFYEEGLSTIGKKSAAALWKAAEAAKKKSLFEFATSTAERVIQLDPDHKKARKYLGYEKKRRKWVLDDREAGKVIRENQIPKGVSNAEFAKRVNEWRYEVLPAAQQEIAEQYAGLGDKCTGKGFAGEARRAYDEAIRLDPHCAKARAALGYEQVGEAWLSKAQIAARKAASKPETYEEDSELDELLDRTLTKVRSANFDAQSVYSGARTAKLVETLETTYSLYLTDAGRDPNESVFSSPMQCLFVDDGDDWTAWLEDRVPARAKFFSGLHFYHSIGGMLLGVREQQDVSGSQKETFEDNAVHATAHVLNGVLYKLYRHAWLDEGMAYYTTLRVRGTTASWCVKEDDSRYAQPNEVVEDEGLLSEFSFRARIRQLVRKGEDMPLRKLTTRKLEELALSDSVKAWSFVYWLMESDREAAIRFLTSIGEAENGTTALEEHFGKSAEAVDEEWRLWVRTSH